MSNGVNRHCPQCGRKAHDRLLVQCPDCRVPFVLDDNTPAPAGLTPEQLQMLANQVFGSWKFWAALLIIVGGAAWAVVIVANKVIDARANAYLSTLEQKATNHIGSAFGQISNQIALEFRQPRIRSAIEQVARDRASEVFTNGVQPSLQAFTDTMDQINAELARSSNAVAQLERDARAAQRKIPPPAPVVAQQSNPPPAKTAAAPVTVAPSPAAAAPAAPNDSVVKLTLVNRMITPAGNNYLLTLFFSATNSLNSGPVQIDAGTYKQTAKILNFAPMTAAPVEPSAYSDMRDAARLKFMVSPRETPTIVLEVSGPTIVRFTSDSFDNDLTIPIAADKMQLPAASK